MPLALPATPLPASVPTLHTAPGRSQGVPGVGQAARQVQRVGGAPPPGQAHPGGHSAPVAFVEPAKQPHPCAAAQGVQCSGALRLLPAP
jgi:hypothetical protein